MPPERLEQARTDPALAETLEALLRDLTAAHEELLALAADHRRAIASADADAVRACVQQQTTIAQRIVELEHRRRQLVTPFTPGGKSAVLRSTDGQPALSAIAQRLPEPARARVLAMADRLKDILKTLHREHEAIRLATIGLMGHMDGLLQQVGRRLSDAGTYGPGGRVGAAASSGAVARGLDMTH